MKRILHFGGVLLALGMLLASCNIGVGDGQVSGDSVRTTSNSTLNNTSNIDGIILKVNNIDNSRTILPADWTDTTASALTYVLLVKKAGATTGWETKKTFSYSELTSGTATVNLDLIAWDLKLIGYITGTGENRHETHPCLEKELTGVNLSTGTKTVTFNLKPVDPTTTSATGNVDVTIAWLTEQPRRLELGIYDSTTNTDDIVENTGRGDAEFLQIKDDDSFAEEGTAHEMSWTPSNIKAGMYKFAAVFYDAKTGGEVIGYYIDYLYVDGGNLSKATVNYGNKFNTIPENPNWLAVETVFVPQEETVPSEEPATITVNDWYYAKFHWDDNSTNETGFELVITDNTGKVSVVNPDEDDDLLISDKWHDGTSETTFTTANPNNLDAGRTWVVLKLKTETLYTAKIRAINKYTKKYDDPTAKFCKNLNRPGDGQGRTYAPIVGDDKQFGMFTVNYVLNGGVVTKKADGTTTGNGVTNYVVGFNYHSQQQDLMTDFKQSYPHIEKLGSVFDHWEDETATPSAKRYDVLPAGNHDNLELTAQWSGTEFLVRVTFPSYADAQDVKIVADKNSEKPYTFKYNKEVPGDNIIIVDAGASLTAPAFELSEVGDNGKIIATGPNSTLGITVAGTTWKWTMTKAPTPGLYCLQITGKYKAGFDSDPTKDRELTLCGNLYIEVEN